MNYMLLIYNNSNWTDSQTEEQDEVDSREFGRFEAFLRSRERHFYRQVLDSARTAVTIRPDGDGVMVTDGPFVDLKEGITGFYVIEADDLDEAIAVAKQCPNSIGVEVRPVFDVGD